MTVCMIGLLAVSANAAIVSSGLIQNLDAELGVTLNGFNVSAWANQAASGGDDVAQTDASKQPALLSGVVNGLDAVAIDGTSGNLLGDDDAAFDSLINGGGYTWFAVVRPGAQSGGNAAKNAVFGTLLDESPWSGVCGGVNNDGLPFTLTRYGNPEALTTGTTNAIDNQFHILIGRFSAGTGDQTAEVFIDDPTAEAGSSVTVSETADAGGLAIGLEHLLSGGGQSFTGDLARLLIYDRPLTDAELNQTGLELAATYNVTASFGGFATNVIPLDGETGISAGADLTLQWLAARDPNNPSQPDPAVTGHKVYFGTDSASLLLHEEITDVATETSIVNAADLSKDAWYFWRVDEVTDDGDLTGAPWSFQTVLSLPVITKQPKDDAVVLGKEAVFTIEANDPLVGTLQYAWKKVGESIVLSTSEELRFTVVADSGGDYICEIRNAGNPEPLDPVETVPATLTVGEIIAHWKLDGNGNDESGNYNGVVGTGITWGDGVNAATNSLDQAAVFTIDPNVIDCGNVPISGEFSIAMWFKPTDVTQDWDGIVCKRRFLEEGGSEAPTFWLGQNNVNGTLRFGCFDASGAATNLESSAGVIANDKWTHIIGVYDREKSVLYIDGLEDASIDSVFDLTEQEGSFLIGSGGNSIAGVVDDVRMYNYALDKFEAAAVYLEGPEAVLCIDRPELDITGPEGIPDCIVDLYEFVMFAQSWLHCGEYPTCYEE